MYFKDRSEAGQLLAKELEVYRYENTAVLALSEGGVVVGEQIARVLHSTLSLLLTAPVMLPGEEDSAGLIDQDGHFTGNLDVVGNLELMSDMRNTLEEEKLHKMHDLATLLSDHGATDPRALSGRNIIVVSDALNSGLAFEAAVNYLKPIKTEKIIAAIPIVATPAIDKLHILSDEIHILNAVEEFFGADHYYEQNQLPDTEKIILSINGVINNWA